ncbi:MAG: hypothetical protein LBR34_02480 [Prevotella sp.]|jgi:hypothetical protein|nr:hypothetical protein [Prevotella sp.]
MKNMAAIVIPVYKRPDRYEEASFTQCLNILGAYPFCLVTHKELDISCYTTLLEEYGCRYEVAAFDKSYFCNGLSGYNRLLLSRNFYETFCRYEYILVYQLDAYVFGDELTDWCNKGYAYVGAPWFEDFGKSHTVSPLKAVGNGGFSLRHIPSFLSAFDYMDKRNKRISAFNYWNRHLINWYYGYSPRFIISRYIGKSNTLRHFHASYINEDAFWSQIVPEAVNEFKVAPIAEAVGFSFEADPAWMFEQNNRQLPFGCHAWLKNQYEDFWKEFIEL